MLWFERQVVTTLVAHLDPDLQSSVHSYVDGSLRAMPEHLRAGVAAESLAFTAWAGAQRLLHRTRPDASAGMSLDPLERSPVGLVRQYVRLFRGLTLFAEHELAPGASA